jgi:hypothetical protein
MLVFKQWKGINHEQITMWQYLSQLKASVFFSLQKIFSCYETQQLILGTGTAIWWVTEPHCLQFLKHAVSLKLSPIPSYQSKLVCYKCTACRHDRIATAPMHAVAV